MILQAQCNSFKAELLQGIHNFSIDGDIFKIALYRSDAELSAETTVYTTAGEHPMVAGYTPGGMPLTSLGVSMREGVAYADFLDAVWVEPLIVARGALVYNFSKANRAVFVLDFGLDKRSNVEGNFPVSFPPADPVNAIIRIV